METLLPILIMVLFLIFSVIFASHVDKKYAKNSEGPKPEKRCPPHRWEYKDQPGMPGTTYVQCDLCKMIPGQDASV